MHINLDDLAEALQEAINITYGKKMGFALLIFDFYKPGISDYVSNAQRKDMIEAFREAVSRLENNEDIGAPIGSC